MKWEPFRIEPEFAPRIWGARSLVPLYPEKTNLPEPIGEAWLTGLSCKVASGPFAGRDLRAAWEAMPPEWRGRQLAGVSQFPILVKFIFPNEKLSIQVHPDDAYAQAHEASAGGRGKTEMWHVIRAQSGAQLLLGMKPGVDKKRFRAALSSDSLEQLLEPWTVSTGDTFFVPAGTPHTIGPGMILCEVQEYSDITYRVYDYGRLDAQGKPRELHTEKALEVIRFGERAAGKASTLRLPWEAGQRRLLSACRYFATERWEVSATANMELDPEHFDLFVILDGTGRFQWAGGQAYFQQGECWLIPAGLESISMRAAEHVTLLRTYVPNLAALRKELKRQPHSEPAIAQTVFD